MAENIEHIEFIKEVKFKTYYDVNYPYLKLQFKQAIKLLKIIGNYWSKYLIIYFKIFTLKTKIFLYNKWIKFSKFCYSINFKR